MFLTNPLVAQELEFNVTVDGTGATQTDPAIIQSLEKTVREFFNYTVWTDDEFESNERIRGDIQLNLLSSADNNFEASMVIIVTRPVFNSDYTTQTLLTSDRSIRFQYDANSVLISSTTNYGDQLSSLLTFYAYLILGIDYDTFSPFGGQRWFEKAQQVVQALPVAIASSGSTGWKTGTNIRNRRGLIESILGPNARPMRRALYDYHRLGLDAMEQNADRGKAKILSAIEVLAETERQEPNNYYVDIIANTKQSEILEIFSNSSKAEKRKVYDIMTEVSSTGNQIFKSFR